MNYQKKINSLYDSQKQEWELLKRNLEGLESARLHDFYFQDFQINVQFNPKRITSSAAKVDKKSIKERACFLCRENRPEEQDYVVYEDKYEFLCNPFPIFRRHFTISLLEHLPQQIGPYFSDLLQISKDLPELIVFYNAPNCGASAPDHLHFQAGNRGFMPLEGEIQLMKENHVKTSHSYAGVDLFAVDDGLRKYLMMESGEEAQLDEMFQIVFDLARQNTGDDEPMLNILASYQSRWRIIIFFREKHRPWQYFEEGDKNILLSPASVDYGGTLITPLEKDFKKITREDIQDIFQQVSLSEEKFISIIDKFMKKAETI
jgi:ATP adenylyltransferase/5',5'''-P-1,P-4-tetraphosphate phosphorylase II